MNTTSNNEKMLVVAVSDFKPRQGGIAEMTHELIMNYLGTGRSVTVLARREEGDAEWDASVPYKVIRTDQEHRDEAIRDAILTEKPDYVLVNVRAAGWAMAHKTAKKIVIPVILYVYGMEVTLNGKSLKALAKNAQALWFSDGVFACSSFTCDYVIKHYRLNPKKCAVVTTGISPEYPTQRESDPSVLAGIDLTGKKMALTLCRLVKRKGIDMVIEAMRILVKRHQDIVYVIAGTGSEADAIKCAIDKYGLGNYVHMTGSVTEAQKHYLYQKMDLFVMPNRMLKNGDVEGFGTTFLEANMYRKPAIGGRSGGAIEAIEHGKSGMLVDPLDAEDIARAMEKILYTPGLGAQMGEYGRNRALQSYNYQKTINDFISHLHTIKDGTKK